MRLAFARYALPLRGPLTVPGAVLHARDGILLRGEHTDGRVVFGEAAPLPGLSNDDTDSIAVTLQHGGPATAALSFATHLMQPAAAFNSPMRSAILVQDNDDVQALGAACEVHRATAAGHAITMKVKVGRASIHNDTARIEACIDVAHRHNLQPTLRLDGNRRLSIDDTRSLWQAFKPHVAWFEEPTIPSSWPALPHDLPLAIDEAWILGDATETMQRRACAFVIKPTILGVARSLAVIAIAKQQHKPVVVSSAFESAVGRAQLCAWADPFAGVAHGLGTAHVFARDVDIEFVNRLVWTPVHHTINAEWMA